MAGALFFICMFVITVCGLLLFRPVQVNNITEYSQPAALEERKKVTVKMAEFLQNNPQIVKQKRFTTLHPETDQPPSSEVTTIPPHTSAHTPIPFRVEIKFQGANLQFGTLAEYDQWIYKNVNQDAVGFLKQLNENNNPELYLDTLKKVSEINSSPEIADQIKSAYLIEAKKLIQINDGFHQQMMQKALQSYLDLEKDKDLGKKTADEILNSSQSNQ